ncbi:NAD(P)/FAD-dependent oxidoreductase [Pseudoflavitalea sp. G-6-1-2]|uniref:NAD(P)/FAD-dependent oxidoreductase n=1 Tax=Pseudoflavitalea sp. G-6-1-2 TaxID=2728841 RepID=UPI001469D476|nr:NAD(P)/FAD-dependent oxidoreductase [Pseudoflavitalea sp. G-6-1-2]NML24083.1 NAD(P)/FAD-dependent oxidoreductase [Pseudoflavitalea sp. G-6-1-2]
MAQAPRKVVVVGGGFGGVNFVKKLANDDRFQVTLVDKNNYHFFPPLLYQVASSFIEPSNISYPFRRMFQKMRNCRFFMGSLLRVNPDENTIETDNGILPYDILVLAVGAESNFFGLTNVQAKALPMKSIDDALLLRNQLLLNMEEAVRSNDPEVRARLLNIVIAGGGPTGVEVAGMLAEMGRYIAQKEYPEIKDLTSHIYLIDAGSALLGPMSTKAQREALKQLERLGVHVILNKAVKDYVDGNVILADDSTIQTHALIWTSGVTGRSIPGLSADSIGRGRRVIVDANNKVQGTSNIYAIGDICFQTSDPAYPNGHPQLAQVAIQQGTLLGKNLKRVEDGKNMLSFFYYNKGSLAIISKYKAVADLPKMFFKGFIAWFIWLFAHIIPLVGFRNKVWLAFSWMFAFLTNNPTLRLIIRPKKKEAS